MYVAATGKMIILNDDTIDAIKCYTAGIRCLEQVISLYLQLLNIMKFGEIELSDGIDFIIEYVEWINIAQSLESIFRYYAKVGLLQWQYSHIPKITKRVRLQWVEVHKGEL